MSEPLDLDAIQARADAATEGPWWFDESEDCWRLHGVAHRFPAQGVIPEQLANHQILKAPKHGTPYAEYWPSPENAAFIAHARQDVPALLAEVERINRVARLQSGMISELTSTCMAAEAERDRLRVAVGKVGGLHSEFRIYEDCGHAAHEGDADVIDLNDIGTVCRSGYLYSICRECCAPGDSQTEECVDQHDHSECWPCPTRKVVGE